MKGNVLARKWRTAHGYKDKGGVIVVCDGVVCGWVNELRNPEHWVPGCIAVDGLGNQWVSVGGNCLNGANRWKSLSSISN